MAFKNIRNILILCQQTWPNHKLKENMIFDYKFYTTGVSRKKDKLFLKEEHSIISNKQVE